MCEDQNEQPFSVHRSDSYMMLMRPGAVPPLGGLGRLVSDRELLVSDDEAEPIFNEVKQGGFIDAVFNNSTIFFPLVPALTGASDVDNEENWGFGDSGVGAVAFKQRGIEGQGVRIGIADSGLDSTHLMFSQLVGAGKLIGFAHFDKLGKKVQQIRADGTIVADVDATPTFGHWHGTHCAGILVGQPTDGKPHGIAPRAELAVARVLEIANEGSVAGISAGLWWLTQQNCDIISISLGLPGLYEEWWPPVETLLNAGVVIVAAVGNEALTPGVGKSRSPANYLLARKDPTKGRLISVGAHDKSGTVWDESGGELVDWSGVQIAQPGGVTRPSVFALVQPQIVPKLVAPGVDIVSASPPGNRYRSSTGSSMAAPHVAGLIALVLSELRTRDRSTAPNIAADLVLSCLEDIPPAGEDVRSGNGRVDNLLLTQKLISMQNT